MDMNVEKEENRELKVGLIGTFEERKKRERKEDETSRGR